MMVDTNAIPQDEYFEWEDIMDSRSFVYDQDIPFLPEYMSPINYSCAQKLEQPVAPQAISLPAYENFNFDWLETPKSTVECDSSLPSLSSSYDDTPIHSPLLSSEPDPDSVVTPSPQEIIESRDRPLLRARDDLEMTANPSQNVDYLAHPWHMCEDELWASRKHLKLTRKKQDEQEEQTYDRLRNASWRAVAVGRLKLKRVDPRSFNWLKDQDLTWLHGPFVSTSVMPNSPYEIQSSQSHSFTEKPAKLERHQIKSALKQPSLKTLLLRGSNIPAKNPKKKCSIFPIQEERRRQTLRFSQEIEEFVSTPNDVAKVTGCASFSINSNMKQAHYASISANSSPHESFCYQTTSQEISTIQLTNKLELPCYQPLCYNELIKTPSRAGYQMPSGNLGADLVSDDMAALSRALRDVVDAHQRVIPAYHYHNAMLLRPTITA